MRRVAAVLFVLVVACTRETPAPPPPAPRPPAVVSHEGGRVVRRLESDVTTLNYLLQQTEDERQVLSLLYDPLIDFDRNGQPVPGLAARWEVLDGGLTYVLHLDPRATFSDGKPVLARDVLFTLNKIFDEPSSVFAGDFGHLDREKTRAVGERSVRVIFKEVRAGQVFAFNIGVMPEHVYAAGKFSTNPNVVGNGPYVLRRRDRGRSILLSLRKDYWREKPHIAEVLFRPIADSTVAWKALQRGDVDVARIENDTWARVKDDVAVQQKLEFHVTYQLGYNCIVWNLSDPLLEDARVRRALAMMFDRRTVIEKLYAGQARLVTGPFTPDEWANNPEVQPIEFNPPAATALLGSAGWRDSDGDGVLDRDGKKFELTLIMPEGAATARAEAQVFQDALHAVGARLEIRPLDDAAFFELVLARNYQAAFLSWTNEPDPDPFELFHSSQLAPDGMNVVGYKSPEADQLIEEARAELDHQHRADLYHQLHDVLARDQPYLWLVQVSEKWAVNRRVHDVHDAKTLGLFRWYPGPREWWVAKR